MRDIVRLVVDVASAPLSAPCVAVGRVGWQRIGRRVPAATLPFSDAPMCDRLCHQVFDPSCDWCVILWCHPFLWLQTGMTRQRFQRVSEPEPSVVRSIPPLSFVVICCAARCVVRRRAERHVPAAVLPRVPDPDLAAGD